MRQLPDALGNRDYSVEDNTVVVTDDNGEIIITLIDEGKEQLGSLDLPMKEIRFEFRGQSEEDIEHFMKHYDEHTLRFGGM